MHIRFLRRHLARLSFRDNDEVDAPFSMISDGTELGLDNDLELSNSSLSQSSSNKSINVMGNKFIINDTDTNDNEFDANCAHYKDYSASDVEIVDNTDNISMNSDISDNAKMKHQFGSFHMDRQRNRDRCFEKQIAQKSDELGICRSDNCLYYIHDELFNDGQNWWVSQDYYIDMPHDDKCIDFQYDAAFIYYGVCV